MYDLPVVREMTDAWWSGLARHMGAAAIDDVPARLQRGPPPAWTDPELLFSQACGYPLTHALAGRVQLVCTPCHAVPECDGPHYCSALVVTEDAEAQSLEDLRGGTCAINARDSHSGCNVLRRMVAPLAGEEPFFGSVMEVGSHAASLETVAAGRADLCAVDAVTHALLARHAPERLAGTRVLAHSPQAPGLPYIAGPRVTAEHLEGMRAAIRSALADPGLAWVREALLIEDMEVLSIEDYEVIAAMEREAIAMGNVELR